MIHSPAFPANLQQKVYSNVHKLLKQCTEIATEITYRELKESDIKNLRDLNKEWFPLNYGEVFYERIKEKRCKGWVADCCISTKKHTDLNVMVGAVVYEYTEANNIIEKQSWSEIFYTNNAAIYVMTLGVIDEFRGKGIASKLLDKILEEASQDSRVKYINLHVVSYNPARHFYQKRGFHKMEQLEDYYKINGSMYGAIYYVMFLNGAKRKTGWLAWLKSFFW